MSACRCGRRRWASTTGRSGTTCRRRRRWCRCCRRCASARCASTT
uniref:Uncharacterized protein n=1 Tax=Arundo donax TaxID=35708 RepID=A0A0A9EEA4_ARUDO